MTALSFEILKQDKETGARLGLIKTRAGIIETPHFVPVATLGSVRALGSDDLAALGVQCALANTYHLHIQPGDELIRRLGGLHRFMGFSGPIFSDSGGFQAFSHGLGREHNISKIGGVFPEESAAGQTCREDEPDQRTNDKGNNKGKHKANHKENLTRITDEGITFKSLGDGKWRFLDARGSMRIQSNLDSDIIMAFDECTSPLSDYDYTRRAMQRTHDWADLSLKHHDKDQAIYGIIQGGWFEDLREESTQVISSLPFDGIAVGGSLGSCKQDMHQVLEWVVPRLDDRPRHLLGIGDIDDIFQCVARGMDSFDCVSPTRIARRGDLYITPQAGGRPENKFRLKIKSIRYEEDAGPVDPGCDCPTCRHYSRAYLRHLYRARELSYFRLGTVHNLHFTLRLMEQIRESIRLGRFLELREQWLGRN